jgi:hypothetical protein
MDLVSKQQEEVQILGWLLEEVVFEHHQHFFAIFSAPIANLSCFYLNFVQQLAKVWELH